MENENKNDNVTQEVVIEENVNIEDNIVIDKKDKVKNKIGLYIIVGILVAIVIGVILFLFIFYREEDNNEDNNGVIDNVTQSDDIPTFDDDEIDESVDEEDNVIYIYQKGYGGEGPIAFTYKCKSSDCDIEVTDDSFILYDEEKVYHRDMTAYELEQINNTEKTPTKSELSFDGFEEVNSVSVELGGVDELNDLYQINDEYYIVSYDTILKSDDYNKNSDRCEGFYKVEDIIILDCFTYNYKEKIEINFTDHLAFTVLDYGYKNGFYYFYTNTSEGNPIYVFRGNGEDVKLLVNNFYINDDKLYYLGFDGKINVVNNKGEVLPFNNDGIKGITIFEDRLIYLNSDNVLSVKNILDDDNYYSTDVKLQNPYLFGKNDGFQILDPNKSVLEEEGFESYRKQQNINDEEFSKIKKCIADSESCEEYCYMVGNMVNLDKNGKLVSKEYYLDISQFCME